MTVERANRILEILQLDVSTFLADVTMFLTRHELSDFLCGMKVDHIAVKPGDTREFGRGVEALLFFARSASVRDMEDGRSIVNLSLLEPVWCGYLGNTDQLEWMGKKPGVANQEGFNHMEIVVSSLGKIKRELKRKKITFEGPIDNGHHKFIAVPINAKGEELKFSNRSIRKILAKQEKANDGKTKVLKGNTRRPEVPQT